MRPQAQHLFAAARAFPQMCIRDRDRWLGTELNDENRAYLKDFGAATASNGAVGLYHVANLTPEACELGEALITENAQTYVCLLYTSRCV